MRSDTSNAKISTKVSSHPDTPFNGPGPAGVLSVTHICYVVPSEEDLGDRLLQVSEQAVPDVHEATLAYGGEGLQLGEVLGPLVLLHATEADADGAGRDEDDAVAILAQLVGGLDDEREVGEEGLVGLLVHYGACSCAAWVSERCRRRRPW